MCKKVEFEEEEYFSMVEQAIEYLEKAKSTLRGLEFLRIRWMILDIVEDLELSLKEHWEGKNVSKT